jgi:hypothetical protein
MIQAIPFWPVAMTATEGQFDLRYPNLEAVSDMNRGSEGQRNIPVLLGVYHAYTFPS